MSTNNGNFIIRRLLGIVLCLATLLFSVLNNFIFCIDDTTRHTQLENITQHSTSHASMHSERQDISNLKASRNAVFEKNTVTTNCQDYFFSAVAGVLGKLDLKLTTFLVIIDKGWDFSGFSRQMATYVESIQRVPHLQKKTSYNLALIQLKTINIRL